jgi:hypothetical protein
MLTIDQIHPGAVAYLDTQILLADTRLQRWEDRAFRSGPFVCIEIGAGYTTWLSITSQPGKYRRRLELRPEWRVHGSQVWRNGACYINNVCNPVRGRDVVFCDASRGEIDFTTIGRPQVTAAGLDAIFNEISHYKRLTA